MTRRFVVWVPLLLVGLTALGAQAPRVHELVLAPANVHWGYYDAKVAPVLRIASGERVRVETMVAGGLQRLRLAGVAEADIPDALKAVEQRVTERGPGAHPMTGPIFVEGAEPGDMLEIRVLAIDFLHNYGVNAFAPGGGTLPDEFPYAKLKLLRWPAGATSVEFAPGITLPLAPFFGSIGVAPPPLWGVPAVILERLGKHVSDVVFDRSSVSVPALSFQHHRELTERTAGPVLNLVESLIASDPAKLAAFRQEYEALAADYFEENAMRQDYLMTRARKS